MKQLILLLLTFIVIHCDAQSTLNASGGGGTIGGNSYDYSIGEMSLVSTETGASVVVTQGLLQPEARFATGTENIVITQEQLKIYPNPTVAVINLQAGFQRGGKLKIILTDVQGKTLVQKEFELSSGKEKQQLDLSSFSAGSYLLTVNFKNSETNSNNTYKIQKIN